MRSTRKQPFCWQEKNILRLIRKQYKKSELAKLRNLYLTITEMDSDFNGQDIRFYTKTINTYSGLSKDWIPSGLKILQDMKVIEIKEERIKGKFKGKKLVFTPDNIQEIPRKTVTGKPVNGKSILGLFDTSEDSTYLEDSNSNENNKYINIATSILLYLNKKANRDYKPNKPKNSLTYIIARLNDGYTEEQCKRVIDVKVSHWKNDPKMDQHLNYITLFRPTKFPLYLEEKKLVWYEKETWWGGKKETKWIKITEDDPRARNKI